MSWIGFRHIPIQQKLITVMLLTSGAVLFLTCAAFFAYEVYTFRERTLQQLSTLGEIIAANSTAALAFDSKEDAQEILSALKAEKHIIAACIYDKEGELFSYYPDHLNALSFPAQPEEETYHFGNASLEGFQPIAQAGKKLGTLYIKSDLGAMKERLKLYGVIVLWVILLSSLLAYLLSRLLQRSISTPVLALAVTAKAISERHDFSVRADKLGNDEIGSLTDAFNQMLGQIQEKNQALTEFNLRLEQMVEERTRELKSLNKELESFSYSVSHDLRAPLRAINSYTNILIEDYIEQLDDEAKRLMNIVIKNSQKMGQLIDDLLEFSKLGRKELQKRPVSMKKMVENIWEDLKRQETHPVEFILNDLPEAYVDAGTLGQVWVNLISNALKYSGKQDRPSIVVASYDTENETVYYVRDNGAGFEMEYYDKLFGVFQRLHSESDFKGTGVGLAIVKRIIEKHNGRIWAEGKRNEGATFYFSLEKQLAP